jgi:hypothetical protein
MSASMRRGATVAGGPKAPEMPDWMPSHFECRSAMSSIPVSTRNWHRAFHRLALRTDERYRYFDGPFSGYLEIPPEIVAARARWSSLNPPVYEFQMAVSAFILDLMRALYPEAAAREVTTDQLRSCGFDPALAGPDPDDYR